MSNYNRFKQDLSRKLNQLSFEDKIVFGLDICKRLLPEYQNFSKISDWGNSSLLIEAIELIKRFLNNQGINHSQIKRLKSEIDLVTPDTDDFIILEVSYALNAACAITELLAYIVDQDIQHILDISTFMTDTVDIKIQQMNENITEDQIDNHPMLLEEFKYQVNFKNNYA